MKDMVGKLDMEELLKRQVGAMFSFLASIYGPEKLVLKAGRLDALSGMRSRDLAQQVAALQKIIFEDPTIQAPRGSRPSPHFGRMPGGDRREDGQAG